nr:isochorismate synthase [Bacillus sp. FJAT-47783]
MWNEWKQHTYKIGTVEYGTGPLLFGGYSFDPNKRHETGKWNEFSHAHFHLPQIMITKNNDQWYVTINKIISEGEKPEMYVEQMEHLLQQVTDTNTSLPEHDTKLVNKTVFHKEEWLKAVEKATETIRQRRFEKVVLARDVLLTFNEPLSISTILKRLEKVQNTSYLFSFEVLDKCFVGATPERLVKKEGRRVYSTSLAGSIRRGVNHDDDEALSRQLLSDKKNLHEHEIVVRMITDAFQQCCTDIKKPESPIILKTRNIQHLFTPIEGMMKNGYSLMDLVEKLHPTPALGGYPKEEAIQFIRHEEPMERGWYAAPIGWIDLEDNGEFVVAIRSGLIDQDRAYLFAGCGIVEDSEPQEEFLETEIKLGPMLDALGGTTCEQ